MVVDKTGRQEPETYYSYFCLSSMFTSHKLHWNNGIPSTGTTAYHQQESLLGQRGVKKAKPRKYFQQDLNEFIHICTTRKESIRLVDNFNKPMNERSSMARIATKHGLINILFQHNYHLPEPTKYVCGSTHIGYALLSPDLVGAVNFCGYEPFQKLVKSNHSRLLIDFNTNMLFGNDTQKLGPAMYHNFTAKCRSNNAKYIAAKHAHLSQQGASGKSEYQQADIP
jgi:hypothetical protein